MCGIAGLWRLGAPLEGMQADLQAMADALRHRGPDAAGVWLDTSPADASRASPSTVGLAHRRLAILDRSQAGTQPLATSDGRWHLVYNGEIYNHLTLRRELPYPFRSHCDTETLLAGIAAWGVAQTLARIQGMFALACWDAHTRTLHLARDAFGKKPLYYGWLGREFVFASELKALAATSCWRAAPPALDRQALALFFRYAAVPAPWCIWEGLHSLPPGTWLTIADDAVLDRRLPAPERWWRLGEVVRHGVAAPFPSLDAACEVMGPLLQDAVTCRLQADVPVGVFLSGGIDSSLVAVLAARAAAAGGVSELVAFTMASSHAEYDEADVARRTAASLGLRHVVESVSEADALACIADMPMVYDEPFADASQLPTLLLSRLARRHAVVLLSGDGGDELFAGYTRHLRAPGLWQRMASIPLSVRLLLAQVLARVLEHGGEALLATAYEACAPRLPARWRQTVFRDKIHKLGQALRASSSRDFYHAFLCQWTDPPLRRGGAGTVIPNPLAAMEQELAGMPELPFVFWMQAMDQAGYLAWDILPKVDRASMAASIEVRCPYLDRRVAEAAWRLPLAARVAGGRGKVVLRRMLDTLHPLPHLNRPKQGFGVPLEHWLRGPLKAWADDLLHPSRLRAQGFLDPVAVRQAWDEHQSGRRNRQYALWTALMFQRWLEVWRA
ncbi:asparagine synthase (glutamine-hydrolyzing) [Megalodesulfovibrio gigas]|uniref:asparagine synthase (glutamine-hydrolyzing) n=1 Tax=Megalodesulfovibrio gigas (strain ATCC 19364 / DSM 1382 / NCIMB 9332 / VKM B-1759) TaxID=1121448 RepID=T2G6J0_MEGG1|nr:asparagine synthase (glutamine-hydrolyzing) [Megalodesulfovibrio gigas]AGW12190.1 putative asparagine synthase [Megalodesulfovibrio gigas DSM 1382 = ATCC 19364]